VQNAVIGMILATSVIGLTLVAMRSRHDGWRGVGVKLALGVLIGGVAAAVAVAIRADLVPDDVEVAVSAMVLIVALTIAVLITVRFRAE
jgi:hypothetical protein